MLIHAYNAYIKQFTGTVPIYVASFIVVQGMGCYSDLLKILELMLRNLNYPILNKMKHLIFLCNVFLLPFHITLVCSLFIFNPLRFSACRI